MVDNMSMTTPLYDREERDDNSDDRGARHAENTYLKGIISEQDVLLRMDADIAWRYRWELLNLSDFVPRYYGEDIWQ